MYHLRCEFVCLHVASMCRPCDRTSSIGKSTSCTNQNVLSHAQAILYFLIFLPSFIFCIFFARAQRRCAVFEDMWRVTAWPWSTGALAWQFHDKEQKRERALKARVGKFLFVEDAVLSWQNIVQMKMILHQTLQFTKVKQVLYVIGFCCTYKICKTIYIFLDGHRNFIYSWLDSI